WPRDWSSDVCSSDLFFEIGGAANARIFEDRALEVVVDGGRRRGGHQTFRAREACGARGNQKVGKLPRSRKKLFRRNDFIDQADGPGILRFHDPPGEQQVPGALLSDLTNQKNGD